MVESRNSKEKAPAPTPKSPTNPASGTPYETPQESAYANNVIHAAKIAASKHPEISPAMFGIIVKEHIAIDKKFHKEIVGIEHEAKLLAGNRNLTAVARQEKLEEIKLRRSAKDEEYKKALADFDEGIFNRFGDEGRAANNAIGEQMHSQVGSQGWTGFFESAIKLFYNSDKAGVVGGIQPGGIGGGIIGGLIGSYFGAEYGSFIQIIAMAAGSALGALAGSNWIDGPEKPQMLPNIFAKDKNPEKEETREKVREKYNELAPDLGLDKIPPPNPEIKHKPEPRGPIMITPDPVRRAQREADEAARKSPGH